MPGLLCVPPKIWVKMLTDCVRPRKSLNTVIYIDYPHRSWKDYFHRLTCPDAQRLKSLYVCLYILVEAPASSDNDLTSDFWCVCVCAQRVSSEIHGLRCQIFQYPLRIFAIFAMHACVLCVFHSAVNVKDLRFRNVTNLGLLACDLASMDCFHRNRK